MPARPPPDYDSIELTQWRENAATVRDEILAGDERVEKRMRLFVTRFGFAIADVRDRALHDPMFAAHFAKEPRRTGLHEFTAAEWITDLPEVHGFRTLPKAGKNALYVSRDGGIISRPAGGPKPGKSLDFVWVTGDITCYAMHKYTKEGGGNQDSQFDEMVEALRRFHSCTDPTVALFVIVDGDYYTGTRLAQLRNFARRDPPRSFALPIGDLPEALETLE